MRPREGLGVRVANREGDDTPLPQLGGEPNGTARRTSTAKAAVLYNVVDDEAPELATLFASVGAQPPDGSNAERARAFDTLLDGRRIREDLGFAPKFPRLADAIAAGA